LLLANIWVMVSIANIRESSVFMELNWIDSVFNPETVYAC
jgi:hypothetical protein